MQTFVLQKYEVSFYNKYTYFSFILYSILSMSFWQAAASWKGHRGTDGPLYKVHEIKCYINNVPHYQDLVLNTDTCMSIIMTAEVSFKSFNSMNTDRKGHICESTDSLLRVCLIINWMRQWCFYFTFHSELLVTPFPELNGNIFCLAVRACTSSLVIQLLALKRRPEAKSTSGGRVSWKTHPNSQRINRKCKSTKATKNQITMEKQKVVANMS